MDISTYAYFISPASGKMCEQIITQTWKDGAIVGLYSNTAPVNQENVLLNEDSSYLLSEDGTKLLQE